MIMEAKEKAKELVEKMFNVDLQCDNEAMCMLYPHAIKCALIAVDELIKKTGSKYWYDVKREIKLL